MHRVIIIRIIWMGGGVKKELNIYQFNIKMLV